MRKTWVLNNVQRAKATARIAGPVIMQGIARYNPFDAQIAWAAVEKMKAEKGAWTLQDIRTTIANLPFKKVTFGKTRDFFYLCSAPQFTDELPYKGFYGSENSYGIYKASNLNRFNDIMETDELAEAVSQNVIGARKGAFKTAAPRLYPFLCSHVSWIFEGHIEKVRDLMTGLTHLGKKTAIGSGRILEVTFEELPQSAPISRFLPADEYKVQPLLFTRLRPPYWLKDNLYLSGMGEV